MTLVASGGATGVLRFESLATIIAKRDTARAMSDENVEIVRSAYEDGWFDEDH